MSVYGQGDLLRFIRENFSTRKFRIQELAILVGRPANNIYKITVRLTKHGFLIKTPPRHCGNIPCWYELSEKAMKFGAN